MRTISFGISKSFGLAASIWRGHGGVIADEENTFHHFGTGTFGWKRSTGIEWLSALEATSLLESSGRLYRQVRYRQCNPLPAARTAMRPIRCQSLSNVR